MHSSVLILSSEFFKASLSGRWKAEDKCEETSDDGGSVKYSFHLRVDEEGMPYLAGGKKVLTPSEHVLILKGANHGRTNRTPWK